MSLYKVGDEVTVLSEYRPYTSSSDYWLAFPQVMLDNWGGHTAKICRVDSARRPRECTLSKDEGLYTLDGVPAQYRFSAEMFEQTYTKDQETDIISQLEELGDAMSGVESDDGESPGKIMNGNIALCSGDNYMIMHAPNSRVFNPVITYKNEDYNLNGICTTDSSKELPKRILSAALKNIPLAIEAWNKIPKTSDHPNDQFTALIAQAVAGVAADKVAESMKSKLDNFIQETYGILPKKIVIETPVQTKEITGTLHKRFQDIIKLVNRKIPVFLTGGAGSGKNHVCKQVAEALGLEFYFSNAVSQEYKLN